MIHLKNLVQLFVILQLLVVSVFGGQGWKHIPEIPAGRRAQYLLLKKDGGYKYGYDTGEGSSAIQSASAGNEVTGNYAYVGGDGIQQGIQYTSGVGGFVPNLSSSRKASGPSVPPSVTKSSFGVAHAATANQVDESSGDSSYNFAFDAGNFQLQEKSDAAHNVVGSYQYTSDDGQHSVQYSAAPGTGFLANVDGVQYPGQPVDGGSVQIAQGLGYQAAQPGYQTHASIATTSDLQQVTIAPYSPSQDESSGDASYSFSYSSDAHARDESSDAQGNVQGTYSFVDATGAQQKIDYAAGDKTGFVVTKASSAFSKAAVQSSSAGISPSSYSSANVQQNYDESGPSDASYNFGYQAADHSRQESSDASGNVQGSFSFVAKDDGVSRTVNYVAGSNTGFVASGAHLPGTAPSQPSPGSSPVTKTFSPSPKIPQQSYIPSVPTFNGIPSGSAPSAPAATDGSYSFSYDAGDHSRAESSDSSGNVQGTYSFVAKDDGITRKVDYSASSATGFVANVSPSSVPAQPSVKTATSYAQVPSSLPVAPQPNYNPSAAGVPPTGVDGSYSFSYDAGDHSRSESADTAGNVKGSFSFKAKDDGLQRRVDYVAGSDTGFLASGAHLPAPVPPQAPIAPAAPSIFAKTAPFIPQASVPYSAPASLPSGSGVQSGITDSSYTFSYDAGDHSRSESGDASGNVKGRFSFVAKDDGLSRTVDYSAGSQTGFIASGAHLPTPPPLPQTPVTSAFAKSSFQSATGPGSYQAPIAPQDEASGDASYSYSYETDSSSKQESSDSQGNVAGSFSFIGGDGASRTLQYTSRGDEGFIAVGDHLPKPGVPGPISQSPPIPAVGQNSFGIKGSAVSSGGHSFKSSSFNTNSIAHPKSSFAGNNKASDYLIHTYLPPNSEKFGYIFDTKGH